MYTFRYTKVLIFTAIFMHSMIEPQDILIIKSRFGTRLSKLREIRAISLRDLATEAGLAFNNIGEMELGKTDLKLSSIFKLAKAFEISPKDLIDLDNDSFYEEYARQVETKKQSDKSATQTAKKSKQ